jgi:uncharacterized phage protein gp47/JayE
MENKQPAEVTEDIAEEIKTISEGVKRLLNGKLNRKAIIFLIQHAAPGMKYGHQITVSQINAVLEGIESLGDKYLKSD